MTPDELRIRGLDAKALQDNQILKDAFQSLKDKLSKEEIVCDPDNIQKVQRLIITRQVINDFERIIRRFIDDGLIAQAELDRVFADKKVRKFER